MTVGAGALSIVGGGSVAAESDEFDGTSEAPGWTALFDSDSGWLGADGIYSTPLDGNDAVGDADSETKTLFHFSDSLIETEEPRDVIYGDYQVVNNTVALLKGDEPDSREIEFCWKETAGEPEAVFEPDPLGRPFGGFYWLGDGFVNQALDDTIYIFGLHFRNPDPDNPQGLPDHVATDLVAISADSEPPFPNYRRIDTPLLLEENEEEGRGRRTFSSAVMVNTEAAGAPDPDGYVYVYGIEELVDPKQLLVARVRPAAFENFRAWEFWAGDTWVGVERIDEAAGVTTRVSNEMSVTPIKGGKYVLTFQLDTVLPYTAVRIGESPVGPFGPVRRIWYTDEVEEDSAYFTYNAKAHPHLSDGNELLVSYNVNSSDFFGEDRLDEIYRPRFVTHNPRRSL